MGSQNIAKSSFLQVWTKKYNTTSNNTSFKTKTSYNKPSKRYS